MFNTGTNQFHPRISFFLNCMWHGQSDSQDSAVSEEYLDVTKSHSFLVICVLKSTHINTVIPLCFWKRTCISRSGDSDTFGVARGWHAAYHLRASPQMPDEQKQAVRSSGVLCSKCLAVGL